MKYSLLRLLNEKGDLGCARWGHSFRAVSAKTGEGDEGSDSLHHQLWALELSAGVKRPVICAVTGATGHRWLLSTQNVAGVTAELKLQYHLIYM